jgi:hypothetical protein
MVGTKAVADVLTGSRFLLGPVLAWLGWQYGPEALDSAALILLAPWPGATHAASRPGSEDMTWPRT